MNEEMMISGKWFNKNTGEVVNVVNNIIDGDDMVIVTDKGTISLNDFGEYIQMSDEVYDEHGKLIGNEQVNYNDLVVPKPQISVKETKKSKQQYSAPAPIQEELYDDKIFNDSMLAIASETEVIKQEPKPTSNNEHIISKFFDKIQDKDKLLNITFNDEYIPINDLKTIIEYMDVTPNEIANYIVINIIHNEYIKELVKNRLTEILKAD